MKSKERVDVLVVEADKFMSDVIRDMLEGEGYRSVSVDSGDKAIKEAKRYLPSLISLALRLPRMNGFEVIKALGNDEKLREIPVVIVTVLNPLYFLRVYPESNPTNNSQVRAIIEKPFDPADYIQAVNEHLRSVQR